MPSVNEELLRLFAADPEADAYLVDLTDGQAAKRGAWKAIMTYMIDVQLVNPDLASWDETEILKAVPEQSDVVVCPAEMADRIDIKGEVLVDPSIEEVRRSIGSAALIDPDEPRTSNEGEREPSMIEKIAGAQNEVDNETETESKSKGEDRSQRKPKAYAR